MGDHSLIDFPRGGENVLTPLEVRKVKRDAQKDILFSESVESPAKRKKSITKLKKDKETPKKAASVKKYVDRFSFKYLSPGLLILGYIKEIKKDELVIGLPNALVGFVETTEVNSYLLSFHDTEDDDNDEEADKIAVIQEIFHTGQIVPVKVIELYPSSYGFKKVKLSILPGNINKDIKQKNIKEHMLLWGHVESIEDHGYVVSFKHKDETKQDQVKGFLSKKEACEELLVGMMKWLSVKSAKSQMLSLSTRKQLLEIPITDSSNIKFNNILPGHLVNIDVVETSETGICGKIYKAFDCLVESNQIPAECNLQKMKKITGRIIHVNNATKQIGVSLLQNVKEMPDDIVKQDFKIGEFVDNCVIKSTENQKGLEVEMPNQHIGTIHISKIADEVIDKIPKKFKIGSKHKCRVLGYSAMDDTYILTLRKSDFEVEYLLYENIKPGTIVEGEILTFESFGVLVKITKHIKGLCSTQHLSDILISDSKRFSKKFVPGKTIKCRVLSVDPAKKSLKLTHKKSLLETPHQIITDYDSINTNEPAHGYIAKLCANGIVVNFYNNIKGWLPKKNMRDSARNIEENFFLGQVVLVSITSVKKNEKKIILSMKSEEVGETVKETFTPGEKMDVSLDVAEKGNLIVQLSDESHGVLPIQHVSDFVSLNRSWEVVASKLPKGFKFKNVIYKGMNKHFEKPVISRKEVLNSFFTEIKTFHDVKPNKILPGIIVSIMSYGLFIEFAPQVVGLCPANLVADSPIDDISKLFKIGQSVIAKVNDPMDIEKKRFTVTLKPGVLMKHAHTEVNESFSATSLTKLYLQQRELLFKAMKKHPDVVMKALPSLMGKVIKIKVRSQDIEVWNVEHKLDNECTIQGVVSKKLTKHLEEGQSLKCYVINIDIEKKIFYGCCDEDLIANTDNDEMKENANFRAKVVYVDGDCCVVVMPTHSSKLGFMSTRKHLNHIVLKPKLVIGQELYVQYVGDYKKYCLVKRSDELLAVGSIVNGFVKGIKPCQLNIDIPFSRVHGRVHITQVCDEITEGKSPLADFKIKQQVAAKVIAIRDMKTHNYLPISHPTSKSYMELSLKPSVVHDENNQDIGKFASKTAKEFQIGDHVNCYTTSTSGQCLYAAINSTVKAKLPYLHLSTDVKEIKKVVENVMIGHPFTATIVNKEHETLILSKIGKPSELIKKGAILAGRILKKTNKPGLLIQLPGMGAGFAHITEISDTFEENMLKDYKDDLFVKCYILDADSKKIDISLRPSRIESGGETSHDEDRVISGYDDIKEGDVLRGFVKSCSKVGVFVSLSPTIDARVQIKNLSQYFVKEFISHFPVGRLVKGKILKIDPATNHIDFSLRGKDVGGEDLFPPPPEGRKRKLSANNHDDDSSPNKKSHLEKTMESDDVNDIVVIEKNTEEEGDENIKEEEGDDNDDMMLLEEEEKTVEDNKDNVLKLSAKFDWSEETDNAEKKDSSSSDDSDDDNNNDGDKKLASKKSKRQKRAAKRAEEESLRKAELALLDKDRGASTSEDFERLVLGSPNSSIVWIQYMAFHLHASEITKARNVAKRALKAISFREEQEKLNVWVALLNLEASYGNKTQLQETFQEALKVNEPKKVYFIMAEIYSKDEHFREEADTLYKEMLKKFKSSKRVWISYASFLMEKGDKDGARNLLPRSMKSLPERKYVDTMVKFGILEFKLGEAQRGATVFETVLKHYPRRTDIWSIYIDMTIKQGEYEQVRNIFERVITLSLSSKKMKFFFKRYVQFEEKYGTPNSLKIVQNKAMEYAESKFTDS